MFEQNKSDLGGDLPEDRPVDKKAEAEFVDALAALLSPKPLTTYIPCGNVKVHPYDSSKDALKQTIEVSEQESDENEVKRKAQVENIMSLFGAPEVNRMDDDLAAIETTFSKLATDLDSTSSASPDLLEPTEFNDDSAMEFFKQLNMPETDTEVINPLHLADQEAKEYKDLELALLGLHLNLYDDDAKREQDIITVAEIARENSELITAYLKESGNQSIFTEVAKLVQDINEAAQLTRLGDELAKANKLRTSPAEEEEQRKIYNFVTTQPLYKRALRKVIKRAKEKAKYIKDKYHSIEKMKMTFDGEQVSKREYALKCIEKMIARCCRFIAYAINSLRSSLSTLFGLRVSEEQAAKLETEVTNPLYEHEQKRQHAATIITKNAAKFVRSLRAQPFREFNSLDKIEKFLGSDKEKFAKTSEEYKRNKAVNHFQLTNFAPIVIEGMVTNTARAVQNAWDHPIGLNLKERVSQMMQMLRIARDQLEQQITERVFGQDGMCCVFQAGGNEITLNASQLTSIYGLYMLGHDRTIKDAEIMKIAASSGGKIDGMSPDDVREAFKSDYDVLMKVVPDFAPQIRSLCEAIYSNDVTSALLLKNESAQISAPAKTSTVAKTGSMLAETRATAVTAGRRQLSTRKSNVQSYADSVIAKALKQGVISVYKDQKLTRKDGGAPGFLVKAQSRDEKYYLHVDKYDQFMLINDGAKKVNRRKK